MATFGHITRERCAQLGRALTAAGLSWMDNGRQDKPEFLTYTATDAHGREWSISPARPGPQVSDRPSAPSQCTGLRSCPPGRSSTTSGRSPRDRPAAGRGAPKTSTTGARRAAQHRASFVSRRATPATPPRTSSETPSPATRTRPRRPSRAPTTLPKE
ncbi:hypothetical protein GCM10009536_08440 [Streptomyces thermocarboxydus]